MAKDKKRRIAEIIHPDYRALITDFNKWRLTYQAGRRFVHTYLRRYSKRETVAEFLDRKALTYCPSFSKAAVNDVKNSIYQRMTDIKRIGGDDSYQEAVEGEGGGVDLHGSSMDNFMGQMVLSELLPMKKVGIYVDMPALSGETIIDTYRLRPYLYLYPIEDIRSWSFQTGTSSYNSVLLRDSIQEVDPETGCVMGTSHQFRRVWLDSDGVHIRMYNTSSEPIGEETVLPKLTRIPFISVEISESLLVDISDYQIALLNLNSSDMAYLVSANFPFYTEQYDPRAEGIYNQRDVNGEHRPDTNDGANSPEVTVGTVSGRKYPAGMERPQFIHPSTEPITASMAKETQLKGEIRELLGLALSSLQPIHASAESKQQDQGSLEAGLSAIGLTMEYAEREIAKIWAMYLGKDDCATVNYPEKYSLKSDSERREDAKQLAALQATAPSVLFKKEVGKQIVATLLERKIDDDVLEQIYTEIDSAPYIDGTAMSVEQDFIAGFVSGETAALARGYSKPTEYTTAQEQHATRLKTITAIQSTNKPVQGNPDTQGKPGNNDGLNEGAGRPPKGDTNGS